MRMSGMRLAILIGCVVPVLTGCGASNSTPHRSDTSTATNQLTTVFDATGGEAAWRLCRYFEVAGVVASYRDDGGAYLTEHTFHVSPAMHALSVSAHEPQSNYVWQLVGHQFQRAEGNPDLDVSPLRKSYPEYAEAVLEILTAPVRMLEWDGQLTAARETVMIGGRPYGTMDAGSTTGFQRRYYQNETNSRVDIIWLANADRKSFVIARGYDYAPVSGVLIPTKIELFRSGASRQIGPRFAQVDIQP